MQHAITFALALTFLACEMAPPAAPPAPRVEAQTLAVSKHGTLLGRLVIERGRVGALALVVDTDDARELQARWQRVQAGETAIDVEMHLPTTDGTRGPLGMRMYKPTDGDYAVGVRRWLMWEQGYDDGYDVE